MVRPKDPFWKYAEDLKNNRFSCKFCHGQFAGGISRIKWHLSGLKCHDIQVCKQVPPDIQSEVREALNTLNKKDGQVEVENYLVPSSSGGPNLYIENDDVLMGQNDNNNLLELNHASNSSNEKDKCQLRDKQLAKLFFSFGIHPKIIVSPSFNNFVKSIVEDGHGTYQLASTFTNEDELMLDVKTEAEEYIENFRNGPVQAGCTLMVNIWRDYEVFQEDFIHRTVDIFACSQRDAACLKSFKYEPRSEGIQEVISSTIDQLLGPNHVVQVLISHRSTYHDSHINNIEGEILKIKNYHPRICVSHCAAEKIDNFLHEMKRKFRSVILLVRLIFYAFHYNLPSRKWKKRPKEQYAFISFMIKSVLEIEDELQAIPFSRIILSSDRVKLLDEQEAAKHFRCAKLVEYIIGRKEFWTRVKAVEQVWFLLVQTRCLVNNEDSSMGYLYQMIERLKDGIKKCREYDHFICYGAWEIFSDMRRKIIHPIHAAAALLDPAYMCSDNFEENVEMIDGLNYIFENMVDLDEKEAFMKELLQYRMKMPKLFTPHAKSMLQTCHPRIWWKFCGKHTPVLRKYAIRILSQPCSTSFCRRYELPRGNWREDWSTRVNTIIINENSKSLELEPIILAKLDAFKDVTVIDHEEYWYIKFLSQYLATDTLVDCVIDDPSLSIWDYFYLLRVIYTLLY